MPTTPSWNDGSNTASAGSTLAAERERAIDLRLGVVAHAASSVRRSRLIASSSAASSCARAGIVGEQALDAERHVGEAAGGVQARPDREAEVARARLARVAAGDREQRRDAGLHAAGADPLQALRDQAAVVAVEADDVGDGAERDQVEQGIEARLLQRRRIRRARATRRAARAARRRRRRRRPGACSRSCTPAGSG